ncbi:MAG: DUF3467 domain-containing protein [Candidatus Paceibacterota bacterium]|jgi:hypothetical protein
MEQQPQQIQIKASDADLKGVYANGVQVQHTKEEFCMDFLNVFAPAGTLNARVITSPGHFKRLIRAMQENVALYEKSFGVIEEAAPAQGSGFGFETK